MTADNEIEIKEAFQRAQKGHNNKAKLVASLKSRYMKVRAGQSPGSFIRTPVNFHVQKRFTQL